MVDFKSERSIFKAMSLLRLDDNLKASISTKPTMLNPILEIPVNYIDWSNRVKHVLENEEIVKIGDLVNNLANLCTFRNFGNKSYKEVIEKLSNYFIYLFTSDKYKEIIEQMASKLNNNVRSNLTIKEGILGSVLNNRDIIISKILCNEDKINKFLNHPIKRISWSTRNANILEKCGINTISDFSKYSKRDLLSIKNFGRKSLKEIYNKLKNVAWDIENTLRPLDLESLVKYILSELSAKARKIICRRYGLWDGKRATLEEISRDLRLTRERIRQIQKKHIKKIQLMYKDSVQINLSLEDLFNKKIKPFLETNYNIANMSELIKIIYDIDSEKTGVDLANEFLSEVFFDEKPIINNYVINIDKDIVCLHENDREFYSKLVEVTNAYLKEKKTPQTIDELAVYFINNKLIEEENQERIKRFLTVSNIAKDATGKLGIEGWGYFNANTIPGMAERSLIEINKPAHFTQITLLMNELFPEYGPFDSHNVHARIGSRKDIFVWTAPGVYGLKRWGIERPPFVKEYLVKLLENLNKPVHLSELTKKVLEECNCSKNSIGMTLDLNKDTFVKYPDKQYGLTTWK